MDHMDLLLREQECILFIYVDALKRLYVIKPHLVESDIKIALK